MARALVYRSDDPDVSRLHRGDRVRKDTYRRLIITANGQRAESESHVLSAVQLTCKEFTETVAYSTWQNLQPTAPHPEPMPRNEKGDR